MEGAKAQANAAATCSAPALQHGTAALHPPDPLLLFLDLRHVTRIRIHENVAVAVAGVTPLRAHSEGACPPAWLWPVSAAGQHRGTRMAVWTRAQRAALPAREL